MDLIGTMKLLFNSNASSHTHPEDTVDNGWVNSLTHLPSTSNSTAMTATSKKNAQGFEAEVLIPLYSIIFVLSVVGNVVVIVTLSQNRRMRTVTNVFLLNLVGFKLPFLSIFFFISINFTSLFFCNLFQYSIIIFFLNHMFEKGEISKEQTISPIRASVNWILRGIQIKLDVDFFFSSRVILSAGFALVVTGEDDVLVALAGPVDDVGLRKRLVNRGEDGVGVAATGVTLHVDLVSVEDSRTSSVVTSIFN